MARIFDTVRPGITRTQGNTNREQKGSQRPMQQPCNDVTLNEDNATKTETAPGDKSSRAANMTGPSNSAITRKQHTPEGYVAKNTKMNETLTLPYTNKTL